MKSGPLAILLDVVTAMVLGLGVALLAMPFAAHLLWGIENDSVIRVIELGREQPFVQLEFGWAPVGLASMAVGILLTGAGLISRRALLWRPS
jgi:hypothetical protein